MAGNNRQTVKSIACKAINNVFVTKKNGKKGLWHDDCFIPNRKMYGHENEMYKEGVNLKRGKGVCMRELRECGGRTENKTKCAKG